ncbi:MAG: hypothetical protein WCP43_02890, partial [Dehalococcoidia bacterium]
MSDSDRSRKKGTDSFFDSAIVKALSEEDFMKRNEHPVATMDGGADMDDRLHMLLDALKDIKKGDFSKRLPHIRDGVMAEIFDTLNDVTAINENIYKEVTRVALVAGEEGKIADVNSRIMLSGGEGSWELIVRTLNYLLDSIALPLMQIGRVVSNISMGDLSQKMPYAWKNEIAIARNDLKQKMDIRAAGDVKAMIDTINEMINNLNVFSGEVTRVSREV